MATTSRIAAAVLLAVSLLSAPPVIAQSIAWTIDYKGVGDTGARPNSNVVDRAGSVYVAGDATGPLFGGSSGGCFVAKYSTAGSLTWGVQFSEWCGAATLALDSADDIVLNGSNFVRKLRAVDGGSIWSHAIVPSQAGGVGVDGDDNIYVSSGGPSQLDPLALRKYGRHGDLQWIRPIAVNPGCTENTYDLAVDAIAGRVYVVGDTCAANAVGQSGFVSAFDLNGARHWTQTMGVSAYSVTVDTSNRRGSVLVAGQAAFTPEWPGSSNGGAHVVRLDKFGAIEWQDVFGTDAEDYATDVKVDASGQILVVGATDGVLATQVPAHSRDGFIRTYDKRGKPVATLQFGSLAHDSPNAAALDPSGDLFVAGWRNPSPSQLACIPLPDAPCPVDSGFLTKFSRSQGKRVK